MNPKYRTELWSERENGWILLDFFSRKEHAIANAETYALSRKTDARVIYKGQIIFVVEYKK